MQVMREQVFYYEFFKDSKREHIVYESTKWHHELYYTADRVWRQGSKGGVKITSENWMIDFKDFGKKHYGHKYVTTNEKAMQEFAWAKLKAQPVKLKEK